MKLTIVITTLSLVLGSASGHAQSRATATTKRISAADVTGDWEFSAKTLNDFSHGRLALKVDGANVSGTLTLAGRAPVKVDGTITGNVISRRSTGRFSSPPLVHLKRSTH